MVITDFETAEKKNFGNRIANDPLVETDAQTGNMSNTIDL